MNSKKAVIFVALFLLVIPLVSSADMKWKKSDGTYSDAINLNNNNYLFIPKQVTHDTCWDTCPGFQTSPGVYYEAYINIFNKDSFILHWAVDDNGKIEIFDLNNNLVASNTKNIFYDDGTLYIEYFLHYFGEHYTIWKPTLPANGVYKIKVTLIDNSGGHESYILLKLCNNMAGTTCQTNTVYAGQLQLGSTPPLYRKCTSFCQTSATDVAWCSSTNKCVYQGTCYNANTAYDLNSNNKADAVCKETTTTSPGACSYRCCHIWSWGILEYCLNSTYDKSCDAQTCTDAECGTCLSWYEPRHHQQEQITTTEYSWADCDSSSEACAACDLATDFGCNGAQCFISNTCCGDDANEFFKTGTEGTTACCTSSNAVVANSICSYPNIDGDLDGYTPAQGDCNDNDPAVNPAAIEICDNKDNNCAGGVDENVFQDCPLQQGVCSGIKKTCFNGVWSSCNYGADYESFETKCTDSFDNDCDGALDCTDTSCVDLPECACIEGTIQGSQICARNLSSDTRGKWIRSVGNTGKIFLVVPPDGQQYNVVYGSGNWYTCDAGGDGSTAGTNVANMESTIINGHSYFCHKKTGVETFAECYGDDIAGKFSSTVFGETFEKGYRVKSGNAYFYCTVAESWVSKVTDSLTCNAAKTLYSTIPGAEWWGGNSCCGEEFLPDYYGGIGQGCWNSALVNPGLIDGYAAQLLNFNGQFYSCGRDDYGSSAANSAVILKSYGDYYGAFLCNGVQWLDMSSIPGGPTGYHRSSIFAGPNLLINPRFNGLAPGWYVLPVCIDSDGGLDYSVKGTTVWGPIEGLYYNATDGCDYTGTTLSEYYCYYSTNLKRDVSGVEYYSCPDGCSNGACINLINPPGTFERESFEPGTIRVQDAGYLNRVKIENPGAGKSVAIGQDLSVAQNTKVSAFAQVTCTYPEDAITMSINGNVDGLVASVSSGALSLKTLKLENIDVGQNTLITLTFKVDEGGRCFVKNPFLVVGNLPPETDLPLEEICPPNQCWDGYACVVNNANPSPVWTGIYHHYKCVNGLWRTDVKYTPKNEPGFCDNQNQCLLRANPDTCINSGEFDKDNYCNNGEWETRTREVALRLLGLAANSNYVLFCDSYTNVLNHFNYILNGQNVELFLGATTGIPPANNFCAIVYWSPTASNPSIDDIKVAIGTSLNQELENSGIRSVLGDPNDCSNVPDDATSYVKCVSGKTWYNPANKVIIHTSEIRNSLSSANFAEYIQHPIDTIVRFILKIWAPTYGPDNSDYDFIEKRKNFDKIYISEKNGKTIRGVNEKEWGLSVSGILQSREYFLLEFYRFNSDITPAINTFASKNILSGYIQTDNTCEKQTIVTAAWPQTLELWKKLDAELRVSGSPATEQPCYCSNLGGSVCVDSYWTCEKNGEEIGFEDTSDLVDENFCCIGACKLYCEDIPNSDTCFQGQSCTGTADDTTEETKGNSKVCCRNGECKTTSCSVFGNEFTEGNSLTQTCNGLLKKGYKTTSAAYGSLQCCSTPWTSKCATNSDCLPQNNCNADTCVINTLAITDQICSGDWGCASQTPTATCPGWGQCVCNNGECGAVLCAENCMINRCEGLIWKHNGICSRDGTCQFVSTSCDDNVACTNDTCNSYGCENTPSNSNCDDSNVCTEEVCTSTGCTHSFNTAACNDNNPCTDDVCSNSICTGTPKNCPYGCNQATGVCEICQDSDGVDFNVNGKCTDSTNYPAPSPLIDSCIDTNTVKEAYCTVGGCAIQEAPCPSGSCVEGSCNWNYLKKTSWQVVEGSFDDLRTTLTATRIFPVNNFYFKDVNGNYLKLYTSDTPCRTYTRFLILRFWGCSGTTNLCIDGYTGPSETYVVSEAGNNDRHYDCICQADGTSSCTLTEFSNSEWYYKQVT